MTASENWSDPAVHRQPLHLFGRHVVRRPHDRSRHGELLGSGDLGDAEVGDLGRPIGGDHDVGRLDVAVNDALLVGVVEGVGGLRQDAEHPLRRHGSLFRQPLIHGRPVHVLHGDVRQVVLLLHVVNGDDAGMGEDSRRSRFPEKALPQAFLLFRGALFAQLDGLDGHRPPDVRIDGVVHHAHGATAQLSDDLVSPNTIHTSSSHSTRRTPRLTRCHNC